MHIIVTSHPNVQGLAVPGDIVVVGQDVVRLAQSPAEVAGLMAHELAHVRLQHSEQMLTASLPLTLLPRGMSDVLTSGLATSYSREMERKADAFAVKMMVEAGSDPRQFAVLLKRIEQDSRQKRGHRNTNFPSWLSTHALTEDRVDLIARVHQSAAPLVAMTDQDWVAIQSGCIGSNSQTIRSRF